MGSLLLATAIFSAAGTPGFTSADFTAADQAVEREFRDYRIQVYNTYRTQRPEYDHRSRVGQAMFQAWKDAGGQPHQARALIAWYDTAQNASLPNVYEALPPPPAFPLAVALPSVPKAEVASARESRPSSRRRYTVRRVDPAAARALQTANREPARPPKTTWQSVSHALYNGVVFGASRAVPGN